MGDTKDLEQYEALKKMKEMVQSINTCMMCTQLSEVPFDTRPMSTQEVDTDGHIWFFSSIESKKNEEIIKDGRVQLIYANPSASHFLSVYGQATILKDREKTEELWNVFAKAWFQEGKDDPSLTLIKVKPEEAYYWDTKDGKIVSMAKIALAIISGKTMDGGIQGHLEIR